METTELSRLVVEAGLASSLSTPPEETVAAVVRDAAAAIGVSATSHWWWAHKDVALRVEHDTGSDLLGRLKSCGLEESDTCILFATDDRAPPWPAIQGGLRDLINLLEESYLFEFMMIRADGRCIAMENHHGETFSWSAER